MTDINSKTFPIYSISIHTPKKGVTYFHQLSCQAWIISIHTPKKGVTSNSCFTFILCLFQSTLPRREWLVCKHKQKIHSYFNPHSQEGSDRDCNFFHCVISNFNPHSQEGSDCYKNRNPGCPSSISIHTPKKGVTKSLFRISEQEGISIHTPKKGVTLGVIFLIFSIIISIHTPKKGVTVPADKI